MATMSGIFITLSLLAAVSLGVALADIFYSVFAICPNTTDVCPLGNLSLLFTWIGSGVWASVFVFISAMYGLRYLEDPVSTRQGLITMLFVTAVFFTPAMVILNAVGAFMVLSETPGATATTALYDVNDPNAGYVVKFILPVIVACLGLVEFFFTAGMLIYIYAQPSLEVDDVDELVTVKSRNGAAIPRGSINAPGFGYYYPSRIYQLPARTPGFSAPSYYY